jgi:hypothetical protein
MRGMSLRLRNRLLDTGITAEEARVWSDRDLLSIRSVRPKMPR